MSLNRLWGTVLCLLVISTGAFSQGAMSLGDCINLALENNYNLQLAKNNARIADVSVKSSYSSILPSLRTSGNGSNTRGGVSTQIRQVDVIDPQTGEASTIVQEILGDPYDVNSFSARVDLDQPIFDGGNWWNQIRRGKSEQRAASHSLTTQMNETIKIVAQYYFDLLKQQKLLEVNELAVQRSQDNLDKTDKMFEIGSVAKVDVFRAKVNLGNDKISVLNQRDIVQQARQNLNISMGNEPNVALVIEDEYNVEYTLPELEQLVASAIDSHPEIQRREQAIKTAGYDVNIAKSAFLPRLDGFWSYSRRNSELDRIYSNINQNWQITIGASVSWNLFNGFQDQVNYQTSKIRQKNEQLGLLDYKRSLESLVTRLFDSYKNQEEIIVIRRQNLEASREEYRLATERFRLGSGTSLDVREAQVNLTDAERILVAAEYNLILTYAELQESIGKIQEAFNY